MPAMAMPRPRWIRYCSWFRATMPSTIATMAARGKSPAMPQQRAAMARPLLPRHRQSAGTSHRRTSGSVGYVGPIGSVGAVRGPEGRHHRRRRHRYGGARSGRQTARAQAQRARSRRQAGAGGRSDVRVRLRGSARRRQFGGHDREHVRSMPPRDETGRLRPDRDDHARAAARTLGRAAQRTSPAQPADGIRDGVLPSLHDGVLGTLGSLAHGGGAPASTTSATTTATATRIAAPRPSHVSTRA